MICSYNLSQLCWWSCTYMLLVCCFLLEVRCLVLYVVVCMHVSLSTFIEITSSSAVVIETPQSQNVTVGQEVVFTCATTNSGSILTWSTMPTIATTKQDTETLPGGGKRAFLNLTASEEHNTIVTCVIVTGTTATTHSALLLVQGETFTSCICFSV